jgi:hypothetical protein
MSSVQLKPKERSWQSNRVMKADGSTQLTTADGSTPIAHAVKTIARAGLTAGTLDGLDAAIVLGVMGGPGVKRVFQFIASGVLGPASFQGGWATAGLGVALHFTIATGAATTYYLLSRPLPVLVRKPALCGPIIGLGVFAFMRYVVVPLSAAPKRPPLTVFGYLNQLVAHTVFVGLSIAFIVARSRAERKALCIGPEGARDWGNAGRPD